MHTVHSYTRRVCYILKILVHVWHYFNFETPIFINPLAVGKYRFKVTSCRKVSCIDLAKDEPKFGDNLIIFHEANQSFQ